MAHLDEHDDYDLLDPPAGPSSSPLTYHTASPERPSPRPRSSRQSSLPRAAFRSSSNSIFGSGSASGPTTAAPPQRSSVFPQRPALSVRPPSNEERARLDSPSSPNLSAPARPSRRSDDEVRSTVDRRRIPRVEKDADDPSTPPESSADARQRSSTVTTLSRLFAVQAAVSPDPTRASSFNKSAPHMSYTRHMHSGETAALPEHLYTRGLLEGRHSDVVVWAFGKGYKLHRLVLDRAPFFATALSEPWLEANSKEMTVRPDEIDASITQRAFELALQRLYGCPDVGEEGAHAVGLFATGCWLEMVDVIESSIESMLRQMSPANLAPLINLVTKNYYGRAGDKILASAKAMLCRDGWRMPLRYWDGIPADIVREILGGDGLFVDGEWERWTLAKRILDRRLKARALEAGLTEPSNDGRRHRVAKAPPSIATAAIRFDSVSRRSAPAVLSPGVPDSLYKYVSLYTHPSVEPLLVLLDEGIHYVHLNFEQLQCIRQARDVVGLPVTPDKVVSNALWQQMELRQRVMNAHDADLELGLSVQALEDAPQSASPSDSKSSKGKHRASDFSNYAVDDGEDDYDSQSWDGTGRPRKFWIPSSDANIVMGGSADPLISTSRQNSRLSTSLHPEDVTWASDFATSTTAAPIRPGTSDSSVPDTAPPPAVSYSHLPPFRFSAEFPAPRLLKERKRVYSRTVFYAGSLWNIYIQKVAGARSAKQLGVYLHRAKERETEEAVYGTTATQATHVHGPPNVEGRIGLLEREMRGEERRRHRHHRRHRHEDPSQVEGADDSSTSDADPALLPSTRRHRKTGQTDVLASDTATSAFPDTADAIAATPFFSDSDPYSSSGSDFSGCASEHDEDAYQSAVHSYPPRRSHSHHHPALPPYVDARPTIKTYFKIFSPSRGGRMLSIYESAPDRFNFSQSWGWKSNTLMLDEGLVDEEGEGGKERGREGAGAGGGIPGGGGGFGALGQGAGGDGRLRFMVVIGNI